MKKQGLRGSEFEHSINSTLEIYRANKIALIQKIPTPIIPVKLNQSTRQITLAYFEKKSTVDYIGVVQEIPVCFDAKECTTNIFALKNIHKHQYDFMTQFEEQGGVSFILIKFVKFDLVYYLRFQELKKYMDRAINGRKSICFDELDKSYFIYIKNKLTIPFLDMLQLDLDQR